MIFQCWRCWLEGGLVVLMLVGLIGFYRNRAKLGRGFGVRTIQTLGVIFVVPLLGILALEDKLSKDSLGTIIGALVGYLLSGVTVKEDE